MSLFESGPGPGRIGLTAASSGSHDVKWIESAAPAYVLPPASASQAADRRDRMNALIVTLLTLACTALAVFDLFLLASGI